MAYEVVVSYRLLLPSSWLRGAKDATLHPSEAEIYQEVSGLVGRDPEDFGYDTLTRRRELSWKIKSSRVANSIRKIVIPLRRKYKKANLKAEVKMLREALDESKKYLITSGQYRALMREGCARQCGECGQKLPKYAGRYPKKCSACKGDVGMPVEESKKPGMKEKTIFKKGLQKTVKAGSIIGAGIGAVKGASSGGLKGAAAGALKGAAGGAAVGAAASPVLYGAGLAYRRRKSKQTESAIESILNGNSVDDVVSELLEKDESPKRSKLKKFAKAAAGAAAVGGGAYLAHKFYKKRGAASAPKDPFLLRMKR